MATRMYPVVLTEPQREKLEKISRAKKEERRRVLRAKIILMAASGATNKEMAEAVKMSVMSMNNTLKKFHKYGIDVALAAIQRSGRPCVIDESAISWIYSLAKRKPCELATSDGKAEEPEELEEVEENKSVEKIKDAEELWNLRRLQKYVRGHCA
ncbi:MAG: hypothetical protein LBJ64_00815, partial [Deltaproteobacteria bacterium]|nr:hypothetical protein [Deltaproteobacteria bacterium]